MSLISLRTGCRAPFRSGSRSRRHGVAPQAAWRVSPHIAALSADPKAPHPNELTPDHPYPYREEEYEVTHDAFHRAFEDSKPDCIRVPGLQEFAAALLARRRIPSGSIDQDPLMHIFDEFDVDSDGSLKPPEIAAALQSRGVKVSPSEISWFIEEFEAGRAHEIRRHEFPEFVFSMAVADAHAKDSSDSSTDSGY